MAAKRPRRKIITTTIDPELLVRVDRLATAERVSRSQLLERFVVNGIEQAELTVKAFSNPHMRQAVFGALGNPGVLRAMVEVMGTQLQPDQLRLFEEAMAELSDVSTGGEVVKVIQRGSKKKGRA